MKYVICYFCLILLFILSSCSPSFDSYYEKRQNKPLPGCDRNAYLYASQEFGSIGTLMGQVLENHNANELLSLRNELLRIPIPECLEKAHIYDYMAQGFLIEALKSSNKGDESGFQLNIKWEEWYGQQFNAEIKKADVLSLQATK